MGRRRDGNAVRRGVRRRDIPAKAGVERDALKGGVRGGRSCRYGEDLTFLQSLPVEVASDGNALVAFEMNGKAATALELRFAPAFQSAARPDGSLVVFGHGRGEPRLL